MAGKGSSNAGNRLAYHDLYAFDWNNMVTILVEIPTSSNT
jgi:hypothetical protein